VPAFRRSDPFGLKAEKDDCGPHEKFANTKIEKRGLSGGFHLVEVEFYA
jgi:hypothetical protein